MLGPHALGRAVVQGVVRQPTKGAPSPKLVEPGMTSPEMGLRSVVGVLFDKAVEAMSGRDQQQRLQRLVHVARRAPAHFSGERAARARGARDGFDAASFFT